MIWASRQFDLAAQGHRSPAQGGQRGLGRHAHHVDIAVHPQRGHALSDPPRRHIHKAFSQLVWAGEDELADLIDGLHSALGRAAPGHQQIPDGLHVAVPGLGQPESPTTLSRSSRLDGIEGIRLAGPGPLLSVGPVNLDNGKSGPSQMAGQAGAVGTGALHADQADVAEAAHPVGQRHIPGTVHREGLHPQHTAEVVDDGGHMHLGMGVHPNGAHLARSLFDRSKVRTSWLSPTRFIRWPASGWRCCWSGVCQTGSA
ncbi:MAG TPA: hypothetical protein VF942_15955 [Acidimicrobiales bacterium]